MDLGNKVCHWEKESLTQTVKTTIFNQVIGKKTYTVEIPQTRVETIINKVDRLLDKEDLIGAKSTLEPFILTKRKKNTKKG